MSTLKPFWNYYGGKWKIALRYPPPKDGDIIIEPFAGAAGYSLRHFKHEVWLVDKDPKIVAVWKWLIGATRDDVMSLPLLGPDDCVDDFDIPDGARWLIGFLLNTGSAQPCKRPSSWMRAKLAGPLDKATCFWGESRRARIADQVGRIKHWNVLHAGYDELPDGAATWFVDPPYQHAGKHYKHGSDAIDFEHLGAWCMSREGRVIVCENEGADWLPFHYLCDVVGAAKSGQGRKKSKEVVWIK